MARLASLALTIVATIGVSAAAAQTAGNVRAKARVMTGVVKSVSASSLTLEHHPEEIVFALNSSTRLLANGGPRDLVLRTPPGSRIVDIVKPGDRVSVAYRVSGSAMNAIEVRLVQH